MDEKVAETITLTEEDEEEAEFLAYQKAKVEMAPATKRPRRKQAEPFVKVPLWWIEQAAKHTRSPAALVCIELLYVHWKTKRLRFSLPNGRLKKLGVSREIKRRVLRDLERGGLITVERSTCKNPIVTLVLI
jgi:hypothetical protein